MHGTIHRFERLPLIGMAPAVSTGRTAAPVRSEPLVGLIRNPRSHRNAGRGGNTAHLPNVLSAAPERRSDLAQVLQDFARQQVDYIAIDGGDGTVRDVLTCGAGVFGETWPAIIVLPNGKTNALAHDLGVPQGWSLTDALASARAGRTLARRPLVVSQRDNEAAQVHGFVLGAGIYTSAITLGQEAHRIGAFDAAVVGLTMAWSLMQAVFGRRGNPWRQATAMRLAEAGGSELPYSANSARGQRYAMFASTLERFPAGSRPFGDITGRLRLALLDNSRLGLLLRLPLIFVGKAGKGTRRMGFHALGLEQVDWEVGDRFILDGEAFPAGCYRIGTGPKLRFIVP